MKSAELALTVLLLLAATPGAKAQAEYTGHALGSPADQQEKRDQEDPPLSFEQFKNRFPTAEVYDSTPSVVVTPSLALRVPLHLFGVGIGVDYAPVPWLRFSSLYSLGATGSPRSNMVVSNYAEGFVGIRLLHHRNETTVEFELSRPRVLSRVKPPKVRAYVPSQHALFVEGGLITAFMPLARCIADCEPSASEGSLEDVNTQLVMPAAGVRFMYFYAVRLRRPAIRHQALLQIFAQLFIKPFNAPGGELLSWWNLEPVESKPVGFRAGFDIPTFGQCEGVALQATCLHFGISAGYIPFPASFSFELSMSYPVF